MSHQWTSEEELDLSTQIDRGMNYPAIAEFFRASGAIPEATSKSISLKAQRMGINPGSAGREPREIPVKPGIKGGVRFQTIEVPLRHGDRIIVLSDFQIPYQDERTLAAVDRFMDDFEPSVIILDGDILDFYGLSTFTHNPLHASSVQDEIDIFEGIAGKWSQRYPAAQKLLVLGNHEDRLRKYMWEHPGFSSLRTLNMLDLLSVGGTWRVVDYGSRAKVGDTLIVHGDSVRKKSGQSAWAMYEKLGTSLIMGHTHRAASGSHRNARGQHILIENGCLCRMDPEYGPYPDWTQAFTTGYVNNGSVHWQLHTILEDGFRAEGRFYKRER